MHLSTLLFLILFLFFPLCPELSLAGGVSFLVAEFLHSPAAWFLVSCLLDPCLTDSASRTWSWLPVEFLTVWSWRSRPSLCFAQVWSYFSSPPPRLQGQKIWCAWTSHITFPYTFTCVHLRRALLGVSVHHKPVSSHSCGRDLALAGWMINKYLGITGTNWTTFDLITLQLTICVSITLFYAQSGVSRHNLKEKSNGGFGILPRRVNGQTGRWKHTVVQQTLKSRDSCMRCWFHHNTQQRGC